MYACGNLSFRRGDNFVDQTDKEKNKGAYSYRQNLADIT